MSNSYVCAHCGIKPDTVNDDCIYAHGPNGFHRRSIRINIIDSLANARNHDFISPTLFTQICEMLPTK